MRKKKLTFFTFGEDVFLRDIIINLRKDYDIKFFQRGEEKEFFNLMHDTDIAWFEWCDHLPIQATKSASMCKTICRLHSYEMFTPMPGQVDWNNIDKLIFVSPIVKDYCIKKFNIRPDITTLIPNGINMDKFQIPNNKKYNKKIAFIGYLNYKKGPALMLQFWKYIWDQDNDFEFYVAGDHQDERIKLYFDTICQYLPFRIHFDGWIQDMPKYLQDKDFVMSTSLFESFQYSLAEGMAQGVLPLCHNWLGSQLIYPPRYTFSFPDECMKIIKQFEADKNKDATRRKARKHIQDNFSFEKQIKSIRELLETI